MEIKGKVHLFFEQSGTFKNEFIKLGIPAEDYDIQNNFGQTDHIIDLFKEIETEYDNLTTSQPHNLTTFDRIDAEHDLVLAFFPCIYFETMSQMYFSCDSLNNAHKPKYERIQDAIERLDVRTYFHALLYKLSYLAERLGFKMVIENPATKPSYLMDTQNFLKPTFIDKNRMLRGDHFVKPTAYWFFNFNPTCGFSYQNDKIQKKIEDCKQGIKAGICAEERSLISPDYARNWICDFILGKQQNISQQKEFDFFS